MSAAVIKPYDGSTPLRPAVIELFGYKPASKTSATKKIQDAKSFLKITDKGKNLPASVNLKIWEYLRDRLNSGDKKGRMGSAKPAVPVVDRINLGKELAALFGFSPNSSNTIVKLNQEAKAALGITSDQLSNVEKAAILRYHTDKLNSSAGKKDSKGRAKKPVKPVEVLSAPSQDVVNDKPESVQQRDPEPTPKLDIEVDPEFRELIPPLSVGEYALLEENIVERGCRDALCLWGSILIDGHNRWKSVRNTEYRSR